MTPLDIPVGRIHLVTVASSDFNRSIAFYEALGFEKRVDAPMGEGHRWVELFPDDGVAGIALVERAAGAAAAPTGLLLTATADVEETRAAYAAAGFDVDEAVAREGAGVTTSLGAARVTDPFPPMFYVRDPDGGSVLVIGS
ncbi:MAG: VOC family protein [Solirubrobacteraceae bacterium]|nr:VOC family protein [Solirubrobacteraceae bacterium]